MSAQTPIAQTQTYRFTDDGSEVQCQIGDTAHSGSDAVLDRDAIDYGRAEPRTRAFDGDERNGSWVDQADVQSAVQGRSDARQKRLQWRRMELWNNGADLAYDETTRDGYNVAYVQTNRGGRNRTVLRDKLSEVELICSLVDAPDAVRAEARTLVAGKDGTGHRAEQLPLGAVLIASDKFYARRVSGREPDSELEAELINQLESVETPKARSTALNLLEDRGVSALGGRIENRTATTEYAEQRDVDCATAKAVYFD